MPINHSYILGIAMFAFTMTNGCNSETKQATEKKVNESDLKESLIKANQAYLSAENESIDDYIKRHQLKMEKSPSGLRYSIALSGSGKKVMKGNKVELKYSISLLNGTYCYSSDSLGTMKFEVEKADVPNGIHEAVQLMRKGDKAMLILPSHLAYGLSGDQDKVPMASSLVCQIEVLEVVGK